MKELYTKNDILNQLNSFEIPKEKIVLIHTSLRSVGSIEGGPKALLDIFIEYFTSNGGLFCVPTHTWANKGNKITLTLFVGIQIPIPQPKKPEHLSVCWLFSLSE